MNTLVTNYEQSTEQIADLLTKLRGKVVSFEGVDRRAHARYVVAVPTVVEPLDDNFEPAGPPFCAATRDLSLGGIALVHPRPVMTRYIGVRLMPVETAEVRMLVEVLRCNELGNHFDIAGMFIASETRQRI